MVAFNVSYTLLNTINNSRLIFPLGVNVKQGAYVLGAHKSAIIVA